MISQEQIYHHVFAEEWEPVITLLHQHRTDISSDPMLIQAASVFEQEFFRKVESYPSQQSDVMPILENLFVLHSGKFYKLQDVNYQKLLLELVGRSPLKAAYNYAKYIPKHALAKDVINRYETELATAKEQEMKQRVPANWTEIYNRLFELLDAKDTPTYFSGPRFFTVIREFEPYHPDYTQYIQLRTAQGKSTTRRIYYYDVLMELNEASRGKSISRLLDHLRPFQPEKVEDIEVLLGWKLTDKSSKKANPLDSPSSNSGSENGAINPIVFISYSWDDEDHKKWVLSLADRLVGNGVAVILDRYELRAGKNLPHFVETSISRANKIIIVFTPNYKLKADKRTGGVGYEYSIMNAELYENQTTNEKVIPILRKGSKAESIPHFMQQFIHIDITNDENFENSYMDLLREIHNEPEIQRPAIGVKPEFRKRSQ